MQQQNRLKNKYVEYQNNKPGKIQEVEFELKRYGIGTAVILELRRKGQENVRKAEFTELYASYHQQVWDFLYSVIHMI